ncbi:hypothetical protein Bp8pS_242 [Bacillus phage vB_BpuM-BpSp]|nr:hypothetical protein Bp8pS_242 [Bacillus phage vB_BpuM-BpSp]
MLENEMRGSGLLEYEIDVFNRSLSEAEKEFKDEVLNEKRGKSDILKKKILREKLKNLRDNIHRLFRSYRIDEDTIRKNNKYIGRLTWDYILGNNFYSNELIADFITKFYPRYVLASKRFGLKETYNLYSSSDEGKKLIIPIKMSDDSLYINFINMHLEIIINHCELNEEEIEDVIKLSKKLSHGNFIYLDLKCRFISSQKITKEIYFNNLSFFHISPKFIESLKNNKLISDELRTIIKLKEV